MRHHRARRRVADIAIDLPKRITCAEGAPARATLTPLTRALAAGVALILFVGFSAQAPQVLRGTHAQENGTASEPGVTNETPASGQGDAQAQRQELENQLADLERQIEEHQKSINQYQKQGSTLKSEIGTLNAKIDKLNLQIKAVNLNLVKLNQQINDTQRNINRTENTIDIHKNALTRALRTLYEADSRSLLAILLTNTNLSGFYGNLNNITLVQSNIRSALTNIVKLRQQLLEQKNELSLQKDDTENLRAIQETQRRSVQSTQGEKSNLLKVTKGKESEYKKLLEKTKETAAQIRSRIFELLGGGELTFEKAYDYARLAEGATGVRASLILAILNRESLLGKNVGRCSYTTAMHPTRDKPYFLDLLQRLNLDPSSEFAKVSCPNQHGSYGGAMGPAQFIPSTWKIYEAAIAKATGSNPPSPWNNADAFVATALYLQDLLQSSSCKRYANENQNVSPYQTLLERCAAATYYAGSRWYTYRFWYGDPVVTQANVYEKDIAILKENA